MKALKRISRADQVKIGHNLKLHIINNEGRQGLNKHIFINGVVVYMNKYFFVLKTNAGYNESFLYDDNVRCNLT